MEGFLLPVLGIKVTVGHRVDRIVPPEEESEGREERSLLNVFILWFVRVYSQNTAAWGRQRSVRQQFSHLCRMTNEDSVAVSVNMA